MTEDQLTPQSPSCVLDAALAPALLAPWPVRPAPERVTALREALHVLAHREAALDLRLARLCAFLREADLAHLGFPSFRALAAEHVPWRTARLYDLMRLACSPLEAIKRAVSLGDVPITRAAQLARTLDPASEAAWLAAWRSGVDLLAPGDTSKARACDLTVYVGDEIATIESARQLARLCQGHRSSNARTDAWILATWRQQTPASELVQQALAPRPKPDPEPASWPDVPDPATVFLGPWVPPTSPANALGQLKRLVRLRSGRVLAFGQLCELVADQLLYVDLGHEDLADFAEHELGVSLRTLQRYRRAGRTVALHPELVTAVDNGLHLDKALLVGRHSQSARDTARWLDLAEHLGAESLRQLAATTGLDTAAHTACTAAIAQAAAHAATAEAQPTGGPAAELDCGATRTGSPATLRIAVPEPSPSEPADPIPRGWVRAPLHLLEAATWLLATFQPPKPRGFSQRVRHRDAYTCRNPECRRQALAVEAHHVHYRSKGGADDPEANGLALCRSCHLRLVHSGHVTVKRVGTAHVWAYPDRQVVVFNR